LPSAAMNR